MIKLIFIPGQVLELEVPPGLSLSEIFSLADVRIREQQSVAVGNSIVYPADFDHVHVVHGHIIIATGAKGHAPTPKIRKTRKFLRQKGFVETTGGKGDHVKFKNPKGGAVFLNPDNRNKQFLDLGSAKSLASVFGMTLVELYATVE